MWKIVSKYYQKQKWNTPKRYQNLSEEEKDKRRRKVRERYRNFTKVEKAKMRQYYHEHKRKLPDYRRKFYLAHKK